MAEPNTTEFDPFDLGLDDFMNLINNHSEEVISRHTRLYSLYKQIYTKEFTKTLSAYQVEQLLKLRNTGTSSKAIANSLRVQEAALAKYIKRLGYRWVVAIRQYVAKELVPKKIKRLLVERTKLYNITVDASVYRLIALRAYLESSTHSQIITRAVLECSPKELKELASKANSDLKIHRLKGVK